MLRISARTQNGLRVLLLLAGTEQERCTLAELAKGTGVTTAFLEQSLVALRRAGLVKVYRGVNGGYALARSAETITVHDIYTAVEGELKLLEKREKNEALRQYWQVTEMAAAAALRVSLQELLLRDEAQRTAIVYDI